jgi:EmrB/QacA subfamily drug resistance transporter
VHSASSSGRAARPAVLPPLIVGCAAFMQAFDGNAVTVALPSMARSFGVPPLSLNLVITAYLVGATGLLPVCGWAAERYGARAMFMLAVALFGLSSIACGFAPGMGSLIAARLVQGGAGALLLPVGRIIVLESAAKEDFVRAMAWLTMPVMLGPVLGPPLGGLIVTLGSWRWLFLVNVPVALIGLALVCRFIPDSGMRRVRPLDWTGLALLSAALVAITYGIGLSSRPGADMSVVAGLAIGGLICGLVYLRHMRRHPHPLLRLDLFRVPTFAATNGGGLFLRMLTSATPFLLALLFQIGFGLSAVEAGGLMLAAALGSISGRPLLTYGLRRFGFRTLTIANAFAVAASIAACALLTPATQHWLILALLFVQGLLRSLQLVAYMTLSYADVEPADLGTASTLASLSQQVAMSVGIALAVIAVQAIQASRGGAPVDAATIAPAFLVLAAGSLLSLLWIVPLPTDAGARLARRPDIVEPLEDAAL